jgi:hypothetical protein
MLIRFFYRAIYMKDWIDERTNKGGEGRLGGHVGNAQDAPAMHVSDLVIV